MASGIESCMCAKVINEQWDIPIICSCTKSVPWSGQKPSNPICSDCAQGKHVSP